MDEENTVVEEENEEVLEQEQAPEPKPESTDRYNWSGNKGNTPLSR